MAEDTNIAQTAMQQSSVSLEASITSSIATKSKGNMMTNVSASDEDLTVALNIGNVDLSCLNEEVDLGTEIKITGLGETLPLLETPVILPLKPKDRDCCSKIVPSSQSAVESPHHIKPKDRDKSKIVRSVKNNQNNSRPKIRDVLEKLIPTSTDDEFDDCQVVDDEEENTESQFFGNRIILGSKNKCKNNFDKKIFNSKVVLEDCGTLVEKITVETTTNSLNNHKIDNTRATKSTRDYPLKTQKTQGVNFKCKICQIKISQKGNIRRHFKRKHPGQESLNLNNFIERITKNNNCKDTVAKKVKTKSSAVKEHHCSHCKKTFPSNDLLVSHMFSLLPTAKDHNRREVSNTTEKELPVVNQNQDIDLNSIRNEILREVAQNSVDLKKIGEEVRREAISRLRIQNSSEEVNYYNSDINKDSEQDFEYTCLKCDVKFGSRTDLAKHDLEHINLKARNAKDCIIYVKNMTLKQIKELTRKKVSTTKKTTKERLYLKCNICSFYYHPEKEKRLQNHMEKFHDGEDYDRNLYRFKGDCKLCQTTNGSIKGFNRHMYKHLSRDKRIVHKATPKTKSALKDMFEYKCRICEEKFDTLDEATSHVQESHPDKPIVGNIQKINILKVTKHCMAVHQTIHNPPVPKNVLFKCDTCSLNFFTTFAAAIHIAKCPGPKRYWKCPECYNHFKLLHQEMHEKQHLYSDSFQVYTVGEKNINNRVLSKCPQCGVHFVEVKFWSHYHDCGREPPDSGYCAKCDILIDSRSINMHAKAHNKIRTEDFIIVEYEIPGSELKRSADDSTEGPKAKKSKYVDEFDEDDGKIQMIFCKACQSYINSITRHQNAAHFENRCQSLPKKSCEECGLRFTCRSMFLHKKQHEQGFSLSDVLFYDMSFKQINPPMPQFPQCTVCFIYFADSDEKIKHACGETASKNCNVCKNDHSENCFKIHMRFHTYAESKIDMPLKRKVISKIQKMLLLKQNKLFTFYQCVDCDVILTDEKVKHHQKLVYECITLKNLYKKCPHCKLMLNSEDYHEHIRKHDDDKFSRRNMKIVPFDRRSDVVEVKQRIDENKYIFYKCVACDKCLEDNKSAAGHACTTVKTWCSICKIYLTPFRMMKHKFDHTVYPDMHANNIKIICVNEDRPKLGMSKKRKADYETTDESSDDSVDDEKSDKDDEDASVKKNDKKIRKKNNPVYVKEKPDKTSTSAETSKDIAEKPDTIYKCTCGLHFLTETGIYEHFSGCCNRKSRKQLCSKCNLLFSPPVLFNHIVTHHAKNRNFTPEIIEISPKCLTDIDILYKCGKCDMHFLVESFARKHDADCKGDTVDPCESCGLQIDKSMTAYHRRRHHKDKMFVREDFDVLVIGVDDTTVKKTSNGNLEKREHNNNKETTTIDVLDTDEIDAKTYIYRCAPCDIYFVSPFSLKHHIEGDHERCTTDPKLCDICQKTFENYHEHFKIHHASPDFKFDDLIIRDHWNKSTRVSHHKEAAKNVLYRCCECDMYTLTPDSLYRHVLISNHNLKGPTRRCEYCKKFFVNPTQLRMHEKKHHDRLKLTLEDFEVKTYPLTERTEDDDEKYSHKVYKCSSCEVSFMNRTENSAHHKALAPCPPRNVNTCVDCGLKFAAKTLLNHKRYHHHVRNFKSEDIKVINGSALVKREKTRKKPCDDRRIYKCKKCAIHFFRKRACLRHVSNHMPVSEERKKLCRRCNIVFHCKSLKLHRQHHHLERKLKVNEMLVNQYDPDNLKKGDRIAYLMFNGCKSVAVSKDMLLKKDGQTKTLENSPEITESAEISRPKDVEKQDN